MHAAKHELIARVQEKYGDTVTLDTDDPHDAEYFLVKVGTEVHAVPIREKIPRDGAAPVPVLERLAALGAIPKDSTQEDKEQAV